MDCVTLQLVQQRMQQNDETALTELYKLYYKKLLIFARSIVRTKETAEEVVEDVFIKLWCGRASATQINNLNIYLYTAVKNTSLNRLSQKSQQLISSSFDFLKLDPEDEFGNPYHLIITSEMMEKMERAIDALPPRCKMIFRLVREDGLKYKEVSEILNISINTIDVQMAIAVKRICTSLNIDKPSRYFAHHNN